MVVGRTRRYLTQTDDNLTTVLEATHIVELDTPDPRDEPPTLRASKVQPTIVTGFSSNHLPSGLLFLRSIGKAVREARTMSSTNQSSLARRSNSFRAPSVVVWAMEKFTGADADDLRCVVRDLNLKWNVQAEIREFDFSALPDWMRINQARGWMGGTGSQILPSQSDSFHLLCFVASPHSIRYSHFFLVCGGENIIRFSVVGHGNVAMGCWEVALNLSLLAEGFVSHEFIPRVAHNEPTTCNNVMKSNRFISLPIENSYMH